MAAPANDNFANAAVIIGWSGAANPVTIDDATVEGTEPVATNVANGNHQTIWYQWTAPQSGNIIFHLAGSTATDTILAVWTGATLAALVEVASNDDYIDTWSGVPFAAVMGTVYRIQAGTFDDTTGTLVLQWAPPPANDNFAARTALTGVTGTVSGNTVGATLEGSEPQVLGTEGTVWYEWIATDDGVINLSVDTETVQTVGAYTGSSLGSLSFLGSNPTLEVNVTATTSYKFQIKASANQLRSFTLNWSASLASPQGVCIAFNADAFDTSTFWTRLDA
jgi:hypothetical protein